MAEMGMAEMGGVDGATNQTGVAGAVPGTLEPMAAGFDEMKPLRELFRGGVDAGDPILEMLMGRLLIEPDRLLSAEQMARELCVSKRTFSRRLNQVGLNYREVIDSVRMQRARHYLKNTHSTVNAIASRLGYSSSSNFIKAFRRCSGMTPREFRLKWHEADSAAPDVSQTF